MSIDFTPYIRDDERDNWLLPEAARVDPDAFEMNVANVNAVDLLLALGLAPDTSSEPMPIDALAGFVTAALRRHLGHRSPQQENVTYNADDRMTFVSCGRPEGYIENRLGDLARLIQRSRAAGATHIAWG